MKNFIEKFLHHLMAERYLSSNTVSAYKRDINQFAQFITKKNRVQEISKINSDQVKDFLKHLKYKLKIKAASQSRKLSALKSFAKYLFVREKAPLFTKDIFSPTLPKRLPKYLTQEQVYTLIKEVKKDTSLSGQRNVIILSILYSCGLRVSELVSLKTDSIDLAQQSLRVIGKGDKERIVPIASEIIVALEFYINSVHPKIIKGYSSRNRTFLFPIIFKKKLEPMTRQGIFKIVKKAGQLAGLVHSISPHTLRHSLATHMLKKGANLRVLQTLLGHSKLNTVQIYTHLDTTHLKKSYLRFHPRALK